MSSKRKRRVPQCARCRSHNTFASVRGHKRECQWKDCTCAKCLMVAEKRRVTAVRVAVLRRERKRRMSHRMGFDAFHVGMTAGGTWGMMGQAVGAYSTNHYPDNRRTAFAGEPYCNEMLQLKYRGMYHYVNEHPHHMHPEERVLCRNEEPPNKADSGISQNLQSFQREYESLMGKLNENCKLPPNEQTQMEALRHPFPGPHTAQRVRMTSASPEFYVNGTPITHGNLYDPRLTHERQKYLPMMLNSPLTLRRPCSVNPPVDYPYRSVCL